MNLKQLEAFVHIADGKSFSKAAKELYLTQPTISAHISSLEKELNARLFVRNTKEVSLSQEGELLYGYAVEIMRLQEEIQGIFGKSKKDSIQQIKIATSSIPSQYLLPDIMMTFHNKYNKEQFSIIETDSAEVVNQVMNHEVEVGFTGTVIDKKNCKYVPIYSDELVIITPNTSAYQELIGDESSIDWMKSMPIIMREKGSGTRREAEKQIEACKINLEKLNVIASLENTESIKKSVEKGLGIAILSKLAVEQEVEEGRLCMCHFPLEHRGRDLSIVYNKNFQLTPSAQRFVRVVKEIYQVK